jgi:hypothetical protein
MMNITGLGSGRWWQLSSGRKRATKGPRRKRIHRHRELRQRHSSFGTPENDPIPRLRDTVLRSLEKFIMDLISIIYIIAGMSRRLRKCSNDVVP